MKNLELTSIPKWEQQDAKTAPLFSPPADMVCPEFKNLLIDGYNFSRSTGTTVKSISWQFLFVQRLSVIVC